MSKALLSSFQTPFLLNNSAADDSLAVVKHERLACGYSALRLVKAEHQPILTDPSDRCGRGCVAVAYLRLNSRGSFKRVVNKQIYARGGKLSLVKLSVGAESYGVVLGTLASYEYRATERDAKTLSLTDGVSDDTLVSAENIAARVNEIAAKYGYEEPMIWSDMLFYAWNDRKYFVPRQEVPEEYKNALPENIIPVYWDYYHDQKQNFSDMLAMHQDISKKTWFAGGVWTWGGPMPDNEWTIKSMKPAIDACREHKIDNIFMTMWGDYGNECSFWSVLPALCYIAEYAKGNTDEEKIKAKFKRITGLNFDECMRINHANFIAGNEQDVLHARNPSKYMLYADTLNDFLDWTVKPGASHKFAEVAADMHALAKKSRRIGYVYETAGCLCDALEIKYELGLRTRAAYEAGDKDELRRLCNEDYVKVCRLIDRYGKAMEKQWKRESKFCGFEAIDIRIGAVIRRLETVRRRLLEYCDGKIDRIEELDVAILPFREEKKSIVFGSALASMGANIYT